MNLLLPLTLEEATTEMVNMVPTKEFFKPVLVITAPLDRSGAELLGCDYLFDPAGNPVKFDGTHKLQGELPGAAISLGGRLVDVYTAASEAVRHFACYVLEKKGLRVRVRIHLPELAEDNLLRLLSFLTTLNKEAFTLTVTPAQKTLVDMLVNTEQAATAEQKVELEASHLHYGDGNSKLVAMVAIAETAGGFHYGWFGRWNGKQKLEGKQELVRLQELQASEMAARDAALASLLKFAAEIMPKGRKEEEEIIGLRSWIFDLAPELTRWDSTKQPLVDAMGKT